MCIYINIYEDLKLKKKYCRTKIWAMSEIISLSQSQGRRRRAAQRSWIPLRNERGNHRAGILVSRDGSDVTPPSKEAGDSR